MALTGAQLTDEVQAIVGRGTNQVLITNARVTRWLNEAQKKIAEECPNLDCLHFSNVLSLDTTVTLKYAVNEITVGSEVTTANGVCYITDVFYLDGHESRKLEFIHPDEFDEEYPDPTHADIAKSRPDHWTVEADLSGGYVKMMPLCLTEYCDKNLRFEGTFYPGDWDTEDTTESPIKGCDDAMIAYAVWKAWGAIGETEEEVKWHAKFNGELERIQTQSSRYHQWDGNIFYTNYNE
jgi:hypothetical protein